MNKLLMITVGTLLFLTTSCDSGDDECAYIGEWVGITSSITYVGDCSESNSVTDISCIEMNIYDTDLSFDTCSCNNEFYNEQECLDYEELPEDWDCNSNIQNDTNVVCQIDDALLTCITSNHELSTGDDPDGMGCTFTRTEVYERNN